MSFWNYRIVKIKRSHHGKEYHTYAIHEVHYYDDGTPSSMTTEPTNFITDDLGMEKDFDAVQEIVRSIQLALDTIKEKDVFIPPEGWDID